MEKALYPFEDYRIYKVFHKKENRWQAILVKPNNKKRTTLSYARYLMSIHLKRILDKNETVDHIDGNKLNDTIENLQILTRSQNINKYRTIDNPAQLVNLICPICKTEFKRSKSKVTHKLNKGFTICCSLSCGHKKTSITLKTRA